LAATLQQFAPPTTLMVHSHFCFKELESKVRDDGEALSRSTAIRRWRNWSANWQFFSFWACSWDLRSARLWCRTDTSTRADALCPHA